LWFPLVLCSFGRMDTRESVETLPLESLEEMRSVVDELVVDDVAAATFAALVSDSPPPSPPISPHTEAAEKPVKRVVQTSYASPAGATKMAPTSVLIGQEVQGAESRARRMTLAVDLNEYKQQLEQNDLQTKKTQQSIKVRAKSKKSFFFFFFFFFF
jgi:hypothetical protein